jgi:hypothetical protein
LSGSGLPGKGMIDDLLRRPAGLAAILLIWHVAAQGWLSDPALHQRSHAGLNKGEASNALRRAVFFHRQGEIRDRTFEYQSFRASGLSLIIAAIIHWNPVDLDHSVQHLCAQGTAVPIDLLAHVAPLGWERIVLTGDYVGNPDNPNTSLRPLRDLRTSFTTCAA